MFSRMGKSECKCTIQLLIHNIEADCKAPMDMSIVFERGSKQKNESRRFQLNPQIKVMPINETFTRTSGFYYDQRNDKWFEKMATLSLGFYRDNRWTAIGANDIDLGAMVDKGEITQIFAFRNDTLYAKINVTFRIDSGVD